MRCLNAAQALEQQGIEVTYVSVGSDGVVDPQDIRRALRPETILISVMHANNELGTIQPIEKIGRIAAEADVYFHCDAVQSAGKMPLDVESLGVNLLSISAHKIYGPKGVGALYVRTGTSIEPQFHGGHHERDRRPGTENVPGIVGFGKAAELAKMDCESDAAGIEILRDRLEETLTGVLPACACEWKPFAARGEHYESGFCRSGRRSAGHRAGPSRHFVFDRRGMLFRSRRAVARAARHWVICR